MRVLHLVGSPTGEFLADLSRLYARDALTTLADPERWEFVIAHVAPGGHWSFPAALTDEALAAAPTVEVDRAVAHLRALAPDVVVPQMFCLPGMTSYRALFDVLGVPVVGNAPDVMAVGADKPRARAVVAHGGVAVPEGVVVRRTDGPRGRSELPTLPVVVKPTDSDNSLGVTLVRRPDELEPALGAAFEHASAALVETYVPAGREVRCGVVECDRPDGGVELLCLPLEEYPVDAGAAPIRLPADKLARDDDGGLGLVAKGAGKAWTVDPADPVTPAVWEAARRCHDALGCRDYGLFDFRVDPDGRPWFLEAGLYCSFARTSVVTTMAAAAGIGQAELFAALVGRAARRRRDA